MEFEKFLKLWITPIDKIFLGAKIAIFGG